MTTTTVNGVALKEMTLTVDRDGRAMPVFAVGPESANKLPALIVIHEIFGLDDHIRDVARRYASQSLRVFAPDLFATFEGYPSDPKDRQDLDTMRKVWSSMPDTDLIANVEAVYNKVIAQDDVTAQNVGILGFCMGGAIAFMFACTEPRLAWAVDYYGRIKYPELTKTKPRNPLDFAGNLKCPLLAVFAGKDQIITADQVNELACKLEQYKKSFKVKVYENADHAFFNDRRPHYDKEAAADAWQLTIDFIRANSKK